MFLIASGFLFACGAGPAAEETTASAPSEAAAPGGGQSTVKDDLSQKNVVGVAVGSPDHTTLVAAVQAGELVDALSNAGPFTVFAPTNAAFDALPAGTVEGLLKPESKSDLPPGDQVDRSGRPLVHDVVRWRRGEEVEQLGEVGRP